MVFTGFHEPVELFCRVIVKPEPTEVPAVVLSVPLIVKFWLVSTAVTLAAMESCVVT